MSHPWFGMLPSRPRNLAFLATLQAIALAPCPGQEGPAERGDSIRVIAYNVQFLPGPARLVNRRPDVQYRADEIGRSLAPYDIVALNETFDRRPRECVLSRLREAWGDAYQALTGPHPGDWRFSGGLVLASRFPFLATNSMIYRRASRIRDHGLLADGFAAKGVLHARVGRGAGSREGNYIDVFVTHLEARDGEIRESQYAELSEFVARYADPDRPALLLGDLNTTGDSVARSAEDSAYRRLMALLDRAREGGGWLDLWPALHADAPGGTSDPLAGGGGRRIDYVLLAQGGEARIGALDVQVRPFLDRRVEALSDHSAVETTLDWPR